MKSVESMLCLNVDPLDEMRGTWNFKSMCAQVHRKPRPDSPDPLCDSPGCREVHLHCSQWCGCGHCQCTATSWRWGYMIMLLKYIWCHVFYNHSMNVKDTLLQRGPSECFPTITLSVGNECFLHTVTFLFYSSQSHSLEMIVMIWYAETNSCHHVVSTTLDVVFWIL